MISGAGAHKLYPETTLAGDSTELPAPVFMGSDVFRQAAFGRNHPLNIVRHAAVLDMVRILGWLPQQAFRTIQPATTDQLLRFHDRSYVEALQYADSAGQVNPEIRLRHHIGTFENPLFPGLFERAAMTVGGSIMAAQLACDGQVVFHPAGGTHHGRPDRASGFCYFNDPVFAILTLLDNGRSKVLYVDLDAHHGDGVEDAFVDEPRVMTISIHEEKRWPFSGAVDDRRNGGARNLPVPRGLNDSELDYLVQNAILPLAGSFGADALVLCCGADSLAGDPLSGMMLSNVGLWDAVVQLLALHQPTVILGGGGYNPWTVTRYWAGMWGVIRNQEMPGNLPDEALELLRTMECDLIDEEDVDPAWLTTIADSPYQGPVRDAIRSVAAEVVS
jgi:acetoin utilization protein AcuC